MAMTTRRELLGKSLGVLAGVSLGGAAAMGQEPPTKGAEGTSKGQEQQKPRSLTNNGGPPKACPYQFICEWNGIYYYQAKMLPGCEETVVASDTRLHIVSGCPNCTDPIALDTASYIKTKQAQKTAGAASEPLQHKYSCKVACHGLADYVPAKKDVNGSSDAAKGKIYLGTAGTNIEVDVDVPGTGQLENRRFRIVRLAWKLDGKDSFHRFAQELVPDGGPAGEDEADGQAGTYAATLMVGNAPYYAVLARRLASQPVKP